MNWYKQSKKTRHRYKDDRQEGSKMDSQLLCCGFPENRRKDPYKKKKGKNYPKHKDNDMKPIKEWSDNCKKCTKVIVPPLLSM